MSFCLFGIVIRKKQGIEPMVRFVVLDLFLQKIRHRDRSIFFFLPLFGCGKESALLWKRKH